MGTAPSQPHVVVRQSEDPSIKVIKADDQVSVDDDASDVRKALKEFANIQIIQENAEKIYEILDRVGENVDPDKPEEVKELISGQFMKNVQRMWASILPKGHIRDEQWKSNLLLILLNQSKNFLITLTDRNKEMCQELIKTGFYKDMFKYLAETFQPNCDNATEPDVVIAVFACLLNVFVHFDPRNEYRSCGAVDIALKYKPSNVHVVKLFAEMMLPQVIEEHEAEKIYKGDNDIEYLLNLTRASLSKKNHMVSIESMVARTVDLLIVLNKLCANESNLKSLINKGAIDVYVQLLQNILNNEEAIACCKGVWLMAFKYKDELKKTEGCLTGLKKLALSDNQEVKKEAEGALWIIEDKESERQKESKKIANSDKHIMISYQWETKALMNKIKNQLERDGFKVWMDEDQMTGSLLESMADGVEKAHTVLITLTRKYKESPNCKTEAEYAYRLNKTIIPLQIEYPYKGDGWLGALAAMRLYFNFTYIDKFNTSYRALFTEIGKQQGGIVQAGVEVVSAAGPPALKLNEPLSHGVYHTGASPVAGWSTKEVKKWLVDHKLAAYTTHFTEVDGHLLLECKSVKQSAPEFFFKKVCEGFGFSVLDSLRFSKALQEL